jgi:HTH-type transcriptional repressor of NAD biosynthesis genes
MRHEGLVFGKFHPFHLGHAALIDFALQYCFRVHVVICAADSEAIPGDERLLWLQVHYLLNDRVKVHLLPYDETELPNTSVSSREVSRLWAARFKQFLPRLTAVFTSEPYGDFLAEYMDITHIPFNPGRSQVPVSATAILERPLSNWEYLPEIVRTRFVKRIVLVGTESTGKSMLAAQLAEHFGTVFVPELARELIPSSKKVVLSDLHKVIEAQALAVVSRLPDANRLLIMDTGLPTTLAYGRFLFHQELEVPPEKADELRGDLYLLLEADAPFVQDGTRLDKAERDGLAAALEEELEGLEVVRIAGDWEERRVKAIAVVEDFMEGY